MASSFLKGAAFFEQAGEEEEKRQERIVTKAAGKPAPAGPETGGAKSGGGQQYVQISVYVTPEQKSILRRFAFEDGRSASEIMRAALEAEFKKAGYR